MVAWKHHGFSTPRLRQLHVPLRRSQQLCGRVSFSFEYFEEFARIRLQICGRSLLARLYLSFRRMYFLLPPLPRHLSLERVAATFGPRKQDGHNRIMQTNISALRTTSRSFPYQSLETMRTRQSWWFHAKAALWMELTYTLYMLTAPLALISSDHSHSRHSTSLSSHIQ